MWAGKGREKQNEKKISKIHAGVTRSRRVTPTNNFKSLRDLGHQALKINFVLRFDLHKHTHAHTHTHSHSLMKIYLVLRFDLHKHTHTYTHTHTHS